ncbi:hypothetical protein SELMODRAFT_130502 [Selaginella moellendorffii]|uniref:L-gulonolactone oxidase n=1 Tax=Selaginella moellendorffii TaxID=88036 RepID=D8T2M4_SELML|nr:probable L-gulonolactone oxidase 6 [Selaginella moellendorffii]EFJ09130.1 hypothetical protein SELMODRAFT_130502 [Selaginella moellendorffii]|eukprot:XP_002989863.1 probable L-gulonolactone oxidase 6 [Selaginella moellendorffii]
MGRVQILVVAAVLCIGALAQGSPIQCNPGSKSCTVNNYQGIWTDREPCEVESVAYPTNEKELIAAVAGAVERGQSIKVVSKYAHSLPKVACPRGKSGLLISTSKYDSTILIDKAAETVTVDAGVELQYLFAKLAEDGLAFPPSPSFNGISVAGAISTGAHGSGLHGRGGALHEYVVGISLVVPAKKEEGYAKVVKLTSSDEDLNAAKLSIGVLGAISQVTFAVEPMFKRSVTKEMRNDTTLEDDILELAHKYDFGEINWHINQGKTIATYSKKVPVTTPGEGRNINYTPRLASSITFWRGVAEKREAAFNRSEVCETSLNNVRNRVATGDGYVNDNGTFKGYPVVGYNHLMETGGGCQNKSTSPQGDKFTCPWDPELPAHVFFETAISIPFTKINQAIKDIKSLRDKNPDKLCVLNMYGGTIFRFVRGSSAYLASPQDSVQFDMLLYRDRKSNTPTLDEDSMEEIKQLLLKKYNGRPHWGKNQDAAFENMGARVTSLAKFLRVKRRMDPHGYFSSEWSDAVLGIKGGRKVSIKRKYCGLEGLCVCSEDSHCAPEQNFFCRPGVFFKAARVCRTSS